MVSNLASTARSAVSLLRALAVQTSSSVPTFSQAVALTAQARIVATGIKGGLSTAVQAAGARLASVAGTKGGTGQALLSGASRGSSAAAHAATALAAFRAQPSLTVVGVVARNGSAILYAYGSGSVSNIPLPVPHGLASALVVIGVLRSAGIVRRRGPSAEVERT
jgi:hypothetical protein